MFSKARCVFFPIINYHKICVHGIHPLIWIEFLSTLIAFLRVVSFLLLLWIIIAKFLLNLFILFLLLITMSSIYLALFIILFLLLLLMTRSSLWYKLGFHVINIIISFQIIFILLGLLILIFRMKVSRSFIWHYNLFFISLRLLCILRFICLLIFFRLKFLERQSLLILLIKCHIPKVIYNVGIWFKLAEILS